MSARTARFRHHRTTNLRVERLEDRVNPSGLDFILGQANDFVKAATPIPSQNAASQGEFSVVKQAGLALLTRFSNALQKVGAEVTLGQAILNPAEHVAEIAKDASASDFAELGSNFAKFQSSFGPNKTDFDRLEAGSDVAASIFKIIKKPEEQFLANLPGAVKSVDELVEASWVFGQALGAYFSKEFGPAIEAETREAAAQGGAYSQFVSNTAEGVDNSFAAYLRNAEQANQDAIDGLDEVDFAEEPNLGTQLADIAQNNAALENGMVEVYQAEQAAQAQIIQAEQQVAAESLAETGANFNAESAAYQNVGLPPTGLQPDLVNAAVDGVTNTQQYLANEQDNYGQVFDQLTSDLIDSFGDAQQDRADLLDLGFPPSVFTSGGTGGTGNNGGTQVEADCQGIWFDTLEGAAAGAQHFYKLQVNATSGRLDINPSQGSLSGSGNWTSITPVADNSVEFRFRALVNGQFTTPSGASLSTVTIDFKCIDSTHAFVDITDANGQQIENGLIDIDLVRN